MLKTLLPIDSQSEDVKKIKIPGYYLKKDSIRIKSVVPVPRDVAEMHAVATAYQQQAADQTRQSTATGRRPGGDWRARARLA